MSMRMSPRTWNPNGIATSMLEYPSDSVEESFAIFPDVLSDVFPDVFPDVLPYVFPDMKPYTIFRDFSTSFKISNGWLHRVSLELPCCLHATGTATFCTTKVANSATPGRAHKVWNMWQMYTILENNKYWVLFLERVSWGILVATYMKLNLYKVILWEPEDERAIAVKSRTINVDKHVIWFHRHNSCHWRGRHICSVNPQCQRSLVGQGLSNVDRDVSLQIASFWDWTLKLVHRVYFQRR